LSTLSSSLPSATRPVSPALSALLRSLTPGQRIRITQTVRVGQEQWTTTTTGAFRDLRFLATGLSTQRVPDDDVVVVTVHFTKDNGELSSIAVDENTKVERVEGDG
jgi:hypothetical protein